MPRRAEGEDARMQAVATGDPAAFAALVRRHRPWVYALVCAFVHDHEQAEDVTQEVFVHLYQSAGDYIAQGQFTAWLKRIAVNCARDALRQQRQRTLVLWSALPEERLEARRFDPTEALLSEALRAEVRTAVESLPDEQRQALVMRYFGEMRVPEIASAMQCPVGTVKSRLFHALRRVGETLRGMWEREADPVPAPSEGTKMPMKVRYTVIDGEVVSESRGGVDRDYLPDPLGSTIALLDNTQTQTDTFTYWPYGELKSRTGTTPTPFRFVGTKGYYRDKISSIYVRNRHLRPDLGRWQTQDPIGFDGGDINLYRYVQNKPTVRHDRWGTQGAYDTYDDVQGNFDVFGVQRFTSGSTATPWRWKGKIVDKEGLVAMPCVARARDLALFLMGAPGKKKCGVKCYDPKGNGTNWCKTSASDCQKCCDKMCPKHDPKMGSPWCVCYNFCDNY